MTVVRMRRSKRINHTFEGVLFRLLLIFRNREAKHPLRECHDVYQVEAKPVPLESEICTGNTRRPRPLVGKWVGKDSERRTSPYQQPWESREAEIRGAL